MSTLRRYLLAAMLVAAPLHLAWEWLQCQPYFVHRATPATMESMIVATAGDLGLTAIAYFLVAALHGPKWGLARWRPATVLTLEAIAVALAVTVELYALKAGRWSYTEAAPLIPGMGISLLPVMQLALLLPLTFLGARSMVARCAR